MLLFKQINLLLPSTSKKNVVLIPVPYNRFSRPTLIYSGFLLKKADVTDFEKTVYNTTQARVFSVIL